MDSKKQGKVLGDVVLYEPPLNYAREEFEVTRNLTAVVGYEIGEGCGPEAAAVAAIQTITMAVAGASGSYTLSFRGRTTDVLLWDATLAEMKTAFELISDGVAVTFSATMETATTILFANTVGNIPDIIADTRLLLTGAGDEATASIVTTTAGELTANKNTLTAASIDSVLLEAVSLEDLQNRSGEALRRPFLVRAPSIVNQDQLHLSAGTLADAVTALEALGIQCRPQATAQEVGLPRA